MESIGLIMPKKWTKEEEKEKESELIDLYVKQKKTIFEMAEILGIAYQTVYDRLVRFEIPTWPERREGVALQNDPRLPAKSELLAEFVGIMLGDGHLSPSNGQIHVYLNFETDHQYVFFVKKLVEDLFGLRVSIVPKKGTKAVDILATSRKLIEYLAELGLNSSNKVKYQVGIPAWVGESKDRKEGFLRGFFDTDGSIYKLKFGVQIAFRNRSTPLLESTRQFLLDLNLHPSSISADTVYLTRKEDLEFYIKEIGFSNQKHLNRAEKFDAV